MGLEESQLNDRKKIIESQLADVEPLIKKAKESVGQIKNENITEIRSLRAPPALIRDLLEGVLCLMGIYDTSWSSMKTFLGKRTVKEEIINFNARNISSNTRAAVEKMMKEKPEAFDEVSAKGSSIAAEPLATWVKANVEYSKVIDNVLPLEKDLKKLGDCLAESKSKMVHLKKELDDVDEDVASLKDEFAKKTGKAQILKTSLEKTRISLEKSSALFIKAR